LEKRVKDPLYAHMNKKRIQRKKKEVQKKLGLNLNGERIRVADYRCLQDPCISMNLKWNLWYMATRKDGWFRKAREGASRE
jgi:hypothetical protein